MTTKTTEDWTRNTSALIWWCSMMPKSDDASMNAWLDNQKACIRLDHVIETCPNPMWLAWILTHMSAEYVEGVLTAMRWDAWETARLELGLNLHEVKDDLDELNTRISQVVMHATNNVVKTKSLDEALAMQQRLCVEMRAWCA